MVVTVFRLLFASSVVEPRFCFAEDCSGQVGVSSRAANEQSQPKASKVARILVQL